MKKIEKTDIFNTLDFTILKKINAFGFINAFDFITFRIRGFKKGNLIKIKINENNSLSIILFYMKNQIIERDRIDEIELDDLKDEILNLLEMN